MIRGGGGGGGGALPRFWQNRGEDAIQRRTAATGDPIHRRTAATETTGDPIQRRNVATVRLKDGDRIPLEQSADQRRASGNDGYPESPLMWTAAFERQGP